MEYISALLSQHPFAELAWVLTIVVLISFIMQWLKQPLLIGYIIAGIIIGPVGFGLLHHTEQVELFSHLGVALLLFMVWLWLNPWLIKDLGKASLVVWLGQVIFTTGIGFLIAWYWWFDSITSIYIAIALAFSSTIIIVKLLSDNGVLEELYGKISIGMLIVQDIIAMLLLMVLSSLPTGGEQIQWWLFTITIIGKMIAVWLVARIVTTYILPKILTRIAKSTEFLLIFAIARCLIGAASMELIGFSLEIGALIAWLTLAALPYRFEIAGKVKSLRDFFILLFFVFLWSQLVFTDISSSIVPIIVFSLFVLIGNPLIVMILMGILWYKSKNGMMVGFTVAQVSEFSFIIIALGLSLGHIKDPAIVSMVTIIGLVTIAWSSYYFSYANTIYGHIKKYLTIFERRNPFAEHQFTTQAEHYDVVVFGNHRTGEGIVDMLIQQQTPFVIVDYDPQVIKTLQSKWLPCMYADAWDIDDIEELAIDNCKMIISTIHDLDTNMLLLSQAKHQQQDTTVCIMSASTIQDAEVLYTVWADYVIVPHIVSGLHTALLIQHYQYDHHKYAKHKYNILHQIHDDIVAVLK